MVVTGSKLAFHIKKTIPLIVFVFAITLLPVTTVFTNTASATSDYDDTPQIYSSNTFDIDGINITYAELTAKLQTDCGTNAQSIMSYIENGYEYYIGYYANMVHFTVNTTNTPRITGTWQHFDPPSTVTALQPNNAQPVDDWNSAYFYNNGSAITCHSTTYAGMPISMTGDDGNPAYLISAYLPALVYPSGYAGIDIRSITPPTTNPPPENPLLSAEVSGKSVTYTASIDSLSAQEAYLFQISNPDADPETCESTSSCYLEYTNTSGDITYSEVTLATNEEKGITGGTYTRSTFTVTLLYAEAGDVDVTMVGYVTNGIAHAHLTVPVGTTGTVSTDTEQTTGITCGIADIACWLSQGFNNLTASISGFFSNLTASISGFFSNLISNLTNFFSNLLTGISDFFTYLFIPDGDLASTQFTQWTNNATGISNILAISVNTIGSLAGTTCSSITIPLPYVETDLTLPCLYSFYYNNLGAFFTLYQVIVSGVIAYGVLLNIAKHAKGFKDPTKDKIEVLNL